MSKCRSYKTFFVVTDVIAGEHSSDSEKDFAHLVHLWRRVTNRMSSISVALPEAAKPSTSKDIHPLSLLQAVSRTNVNEP